MTAALVDGNSLGWRAYHSHRGLSYNGIPTGMVFGFLQQLRASLEACGAARCAVVWDAGRPAFRLALWRDYKKRPDPTPERAEMVAEYRRQEATLRAPGGMLSRLGVAQAWAEGWEADDVLALLAQRGCGTAKRVVVVSGDRDMWQLVDERVHVLDLARGDTVTPDNFEAVTGLPDGETWLRFRALTGDASDNVPNVERGMGPVRAKALLETFGKLEAWVSSTPERKATFARNMQLMSLAGSRVWLFEAVGMGDSTLSWTAPARDLGAARRAAHGSGMDSLVAKWGEWARPFAALTAWEKA